MNHNLDPGPVRPPFTRESGMLVLIDQYDRELRLHRNDLGMWLGYRWRQDAGGREICALAWGLSAAEWQACGAALAAGVGSATA